jgi:hypothetical protein
VYCESKEIDSYLYFPYGEFYIGMLFIEFIKVVSMFVFFFVVSYKDVIYIYI